MNNISRSLDLVWYMEGIFNKYMVKLNKDLPLSAAILITTLKRANQRAKGKLGLMGVKAKVKARGKPAFKGSHLPFLYFLPNIPLKRFPMMATINIAHLAVLWCLHISGIANSVKQSCRKSQQGVGIFSVPVKCHHPHFKALMKKRILLSLLSHTPMSFPVELEIHLLEGRLFRRILPLVVPVSLLLGLRTLSLLLKNWPNPLQGMMACT